MTTPGILNARRITREEIRTILDNAPEPLTSGEIGRRLRDTEQIKAGADISFIPTLLDMARDRDILSATGPDENLATFGWWEPQAWGDMFGTRFGTRQLADRLLTHAERSKVETARLNQLVDAALHGLAGVGLRAVVVPSPDGASACINLTARGLDQLTTVLTDWTHLRLDTP